MYRYMDIPSYDGSPVQVVLETYEVIRATPKGVWIRVYSAEKFVLNASHKRFAHETPEGAMVSFIARKNKQVKILTDRLNRVYRALEAVGQPVEDKQAILLSPFRA